MHLFRSTGIYEADWSSRVKQVERIMVVMVSEQRHQGWVLKHLGRTNEIDEGGGDEHTVRSSKSVELT